MPLQHILLAFEYRQSSCVLQRRAFSVFKAAVCIMDPIVRKGQSTPQTLMRWCLCASDPLLCSHPWLQIMCENHPHGLLFPRPCSSYMRGVISLLRDIGVPDANDTTSHCFRRGAGVDILESHGLRAMLRFGQWRSPQSASAYASLDEQAATGLGRLCADLSDDDE